MKGKRIPLLLGVLLVILPFALCAQDVTAISWSDSLDSLGSIQAGTVLRLSLPPATGSQRTVWGTDIYTSDSAIGWAAVHAGAITAATGGIVVVEVMGAQTSYTGSTRNGIQTSNYGSWSRSYRFVKSDTAVQTIPITWSQTTIALGIDRNFGYQIMLAIPPAPSGTSQASIWGTDVYSSDSPIAWAAVHAGVITAERGGTVLLTVREGQSSYEASTRNGVRSSSWGSWSSSFAFSR